MAARTKRTAVLTLGDPADACRIRPGQRRLIFATSTSVGLRGEQLLGLVESASRGRTANISQLTMTEARWLTGVVKTMERVQHHPPLGPLRQLDHSPEMIRAAARAAAARAR